MKSPFREKKIKWIEKQLGGDYNLCLTYENKLGTVGSSQNPSKKNI
jgi:hypothetical protein